MKYILLLLCISCRPILIDPYDYVIILKNNTLLCDYRLADNLYKRCENTSGMRIDEVYFTSGYVYAIKEI